MPLIWREQICPIVTDFQIRLLLLSEPWLPSLPVCLPDSPFWKSAFEAIWPGWNELFPIDRSSTGRYPAYTEPTALRLCLPLLAWLASRLRGKGAWVPLFSRRFHISSITSLASLPRLQRTRWVQVSYRSKSVIPRCHKQVYIRGQLKFRVLLSFLSCLTTKEGT